MSVYVLPFLLMGKWTFGREDLLEYESQNDVRRAIMEMNMTEGYEAFSLPDFLKSVCAESVFSFENTWMRKKGKTIIMLKLFSV